MQHFNVINHDGLVVGEYEGHGAIKSANSEYACDFRVEHHVELGVRLTCIIHGPCPSLDDDEWSFIGETHDCVFRLSSFGRGHVLKSEYSSAGPTRIHCLLHGIDVTNEDDHQISHLCYGM